MQNKESGKNLVHVQMANIDILQILKVVYIATVEHIAISCGAFSQNNPKTNIWSMYITFDS